MDNTTPDPVSSDLKLRSSGHIWVVRILQFIFAIVVLANYAKVASEWAGIACSTPSNIAYTIAISSITFPLLIYIILTTGPFSHLLWYSFGGVVVFDVLMLILWLAVASIGYSCTRICSACTTNDGTYSMRTLSCTCYGGSYKRAKIDLDVDPDTDPEINDSFKDLPSDIHDHIKDGFAIVEIFLFLWTLFWTIYLQRKMEQRRKEEVAGSGGVSGVEMGTTA